MKLIEWSHIDNQFLPWVSRLCDDLGLSSIQARSVASHINVEISDLSKSTKERLLLISPISLESRIDEIMAFQSWMDMASVIQNPAVTRAQVITQMYICFVYLRESWFQVLHQELAPNTTTSLCCTFLLSEPIRRFRNAFAHGNWQYLSDFTGLEFWARAKGSGEKEVKSIIMQRDLNFWQAISRCTAYASMISLINT